MHAPLIVSWPQGLPRAADDSGVRAQSAYVTDLGLTLLDLAGVPHLRQRAGKAAKEVDGTSFARVLADASCTSMRTTQYAEMNGNRAYYRDNWKIVTEHRPATEYSDAEWELYDLATDPTEVVNVASEHPELVRELAGEWHRTAWHNTVFPLDDQGTYYNVRPSTELRLERPVTLYPGTPTLERFRSHKLTHMRSFDIGLRFGWRPDDSGVLVAHGDQGGGYVLYVQGGLLRLSYNQYGEMFRTSMPLEREGQQEVLVSFIARSGLEWDIALRGDEGTGAALGGVLQLVGMSPFTGISVGVDRGSPVDWELFEHKRSFPFTGTGLEVRYVPGERAPYSVDVIREMERATELIFE